MFRILYVDDEPDLLEIGKLFLEQGGQFIVDIRTSASAGLTLLASANYDAIISDYQMPEMDGIEFLKKVRTSGSTIPFILFTGRGREEVVILALNAGADFYLQKGGEPESQFAELAHKVRQAVQQRLAEASIRDHERREADIINFLPDATFAIDTNGVVIAWNRAMEEMTGVTAAGMLGKGNYEYAIPIYHERRPVLIDLLLHDDPSIAAKYPLMKRDGRTLIAEETSPDFYNGRGATIWFTASPLYNIQGTVVGAIESIRDITERKRAEEDAKKAHEDLEASCEELTATEEELRQLIDDLVKSERAVRESEQVMSAIVLGSPIPQFVIDRNHRILHWNRALEDYSGISANEVAGTKQQWRAFYPEERPCMADLLVDGEIEKIQQWYSGRFAKSRFIDGAYEATDFFPKIRGGTWLYFTAAPIRDLNGTVIGAVETLEDTTERKEAEREILKKNEELSASYEQISATEEELRQNLDEIVTSQRLLKESEEKYRTVFENTGTATVVVEESGIISLANNEFAQLSGFSKDDIEGKKSWTEFVVKEDLERMLAQHRLRRQDREKALTHYEFRFVTKSGDIRTIYLSIDVIPGTKKSIASLLDITGRKQAEELYRTIFENTGTAMIIIEEDTTISHVNDEMEKIWGYSREEIEGRVKWPKLVAAEDLGKMLEYHRLRRTDPGSAPRNYEFRFVHKDRGLRDAALTAAMIPGTKKSVISLRDITEFKKTEHALLESEERYRNVVEDQTEFICRFLPDGTHIFVNDAYCRYFNMKREEIIGHRFRPVLHPEDREIVARHIASITPQHPVMNIDQRIIMPDGSIRWQRWSDRAIFDPSGTITEYQSVGRDITERKQAEEALRQANRKLTLLSGITRHDINNQITMLMGFLRILEKKQPDPTLSEYFQKISTTAKRISAMIQFTKEYEQIGVHAPVWQDTRTLVGTAAKEAPLGKVMVKNDLPAGTEVFADPLIVKVFSNLMDNAVRYGGKITTIQFTVQESGDDHLIVCEDDGEGIPADKKEKIFDRGFGKNTGMGLFLAREILSITGMTIKEMGEPGKRARFEMAVPANNYRTQLPDDEMCGGER
jgi:PAS domain S-box-containing protein